MFLDYKIYKLERSIKAIQSHIERKREKIADDDEDGQAYLLTQKHYWKEDQYKLDKLKARRYIKREQAEGRAIQMMSL